MSSRGTIGGGPPVDKICRNCASWSIGGKCSVWKQYKYALHSACGSFWTKEDAGTKSNKT